jgi:type I restriction enzyme S subunit
MENDYKALKLEQIELLNSTKNSAKLKLREKFKEMEWFFSFNDELPKNWIDVNILDVTWLVTCGVAKKPNYIEEGIPFLSAQNARPFKANLNKIKYISQDQFETLTVGGKPEKNDILYTRVGNCGEAAKIPFEFDFAIYVSLTLIKPIHQIIDSDYLVAFLNSYYGLTQAKAGAIGSGLKNLNVNNVRRYRIPLPPLAEQQRIVNKLDTIFKHLDALKTRLDNIPKLLKNFRQAILTQAVTGKLTEEWRVGKELEDVGVHFKNTIEKRKIEYNELTIKAKENGERKPRKVFLDKLPEIDEIDVSVPVTWKQTNIHFLSFVTKLAGFEYSDHFDMKPEGEIPVVRAQNVQMGEFVDKNRLYIKKEVSDFLVRSQLTGRELLMVFIGAGTGNVALAPTKERWHLAPNVAKIDVDCINREYLYYYLQSNLGVKNVLSRTKATAQPSLSMQTIREIVTIVPPLKEQTEIVKRVEHLFAKADAIEAQYQSLTTKIDSLPQAILAKAFKGELVEQLDTDGDAKELLAEIQKLKAAAQPKKKKSASRKKKVE